MASNLHIDDVYASNRIRWNRTRRCEHWTTFTKSFAVEKMSQQTSICKLWGPICVSLPVVTWIWAKLFFFFLHSPVFGINVSLKPHNFISLTEFDNCSRSRWLPCSEIRIKLSFQILCLIGNVSIASPNDIKIATKSFFFLSNWFMFGQAFWMAGLFYDIRSIGRIEIVFGLMSEMWTIFDWFAFRLNDRCSSKWVHTARGIHVKRVQNWLLDVTKWMGIDNTRRWGESNCILFNIHSFRLNYHFRVCARVQAMHLHMLRVQICMNVFVCMVESAGEILLVAKCYRVVAFACQ